MCSRHIRLFFVRATSQVRTHPHIHIHIHTYTYTQNYKKVAEALPRR